MPSQSDANEIVAALRRTGWVEDGDLLELVPLLAIAAGSTVDWSPATATAMNNFALELGINTEMSAEEVRLRVEAHYAAPPRAAKVTQLRELMRQALARGLDPRAAARALSFLGVSAAKPSGDPPAGPTTSSGPFARLNLAAMLPHDKS